MAKPPRKPPTKDEKLAACLLMIADLQGNGIPFRDAQQMHPEQIISLFHFDHAHTVATDGGNHPTNLTPRFRPEHMEKTATIDTPRIYKGRRIAEAEADHHERMRAKLLAPTIDDALEALKTVNDAARKAGFRWPQGRKIQNRGFPKKVSAK